MTAGRTVSEIAMTQPDAGGKTRSPLHIVDFALTLVRFYEKQFSVNQNVHKKGRNWLCSQWFQDFHDERIHYGCGRYQLGGDNGSSWHSLFLVDAILQVSRKI